MTLLGAGKYCGLTGLWKHIAIDATPAFDITSITLKEFSEVLFYLYDTFLRLQILCDLHVQIFATIKASLDTNAREWPGVDNFP